MTGASPAVPEEMMGELLAVTERLIGLLDAETALLRADRPRELSTLAAEKGRLAEIFSDDSMASFRTAALSLLRHAPPFTAKTLEAEQARLEDRIARFGRCEDAVNIWTTLGVPDALSIPAMPYADFVALADRLETSHHDAR